MEVKLKQIKKPLILIAFGVILFLGLNNIALLFNALGRLMTILSPFLLGIAIAFIFNGPMVSIENVLYGEKGPLRNLYEPIKRPLSYIITLIFFSVIIFVLLFLVIPELTVAAVELGNKIPEYLKKVYDFMRRIFENNPFIINKLEEVDWMNMGGNVVSFFRRNSGNFLGSTYNVASSAIGSIINFGLAFVFSVYALWFLLIFIVIYQVEGNLIYPIVVGQASGLSSIWIFVAGTLGAKIGGIAGLVLSIPIFSVIYALLADSANRRLQEKNIENVNEVEIQER